MAQAKWDTDPSDGKGIELTKADRTVVTIKVGDCIPDIGVISEFISHPIYNRIVSIRLYHYQGLVAFEDIPLDDDRINSIESDCPIPDNMAGIIQPRQRAGKRRSRQRRRQRKSRRSKRSKSRKND